MKNFNNPAINSSDDIDLVRASLNISQYIEYPDLKVEDYLEKLDNMTEGIRATLTTDPDSFQIIQKINSYLYDVEGFTGNRDDYYEPKNSFLNDVIDTKKGIPISLSILYIHIANSLGLRLSGVCFPGHFLVKTELTDKEIIIDPFNHGNILSRNDCQAILDNLFGEKLSLEDRFLEEAAKKQVLKRVINNLKNIYLSKKDYEKAYRTVNLMLLLDPADIEQLRDRALICINMEYYTQSLKDLESYFSNPLSLAQKEDEELRNYIPILKNIVATMN